MSRPRVFTLTANRDIPELHLTTGDAVTVDRRHPVAPVTLTGAAGARIPMMEAKYLDLLGTLTFQSRPHHRRKAGEVAPFTVAPSYVGAQHTLENIHAEVRGWASTAKRRAADRRALRDAVRTALGAASSDAPREPHASALLGLEAYRQLAQWLSKKYDATP